MKIIKKIPYVVVGLILIVICHFIGWPEDIFEYESLGR